MGKFENWARAAGFHDLETVDDRYADDFLQHCYLGWCAALDACEIIAYWDGDLSEISASFEVEKTAYHTTPVYKLPESCGSQP